MKRLSDDVPDQATGGNDVFDSMVTAEAACPSDNPKTRIPDERELEAEMDRRANAFTAVLTRIIENPAAPRYWGLNE